MISDAPPFVLRLSKDERRVFQQNQKKKTVPFKFPQLPFSKLIELAELDSDPALRRSEDVKMRVA